VFISFRRDLVSRTFGDGKMTTDDWNFGVINKEMTEEIITVNKPVSESIVRYFNRKLRRLKESNLNSTGAWVFISFVLVSISQVVISSQYKNQYSDPRLSTCRKFFYITLISE
jgi:hypothetical protein